MTQIEYKDPTEFSEGQTIVTSSGTKYIVYELQSKSVKCKKKLTRKIPAPTFKNPDRMIEKEIVVPELVTVFTKVILKGVRLGLLMELEPYINKHYTLYKGDIIDPAPWLEYSGSTEHSIFEEQ